MDLHRGRLVYGTQGNVSGIYRKKKMVFIKPSGVSYEELTEKMIVPVDMDGRVKGGRLKPSVDTVHHLHLYRYFPDIGGVCHTHSRFVTVFAVLGLPVPTFSTGHADVFGGEIPVTPYVDNREDAIAKVRNICGSTNPEEADPVSIRGAYGRITTKGVYENVIHASTNPEESEREIKLWFSPDEIIVDLYPTKMAKQSVEKRVWA